MGFGGKIKYGFACARIRAWKSQMMTKKDYQDLFETQNLYAALDVLSKTGYGKYIKEELREQGSEKIVNELEGVLRGIILKEFRKLYAMVDPDSAEGLKKFVKRHDVSNIRIVLMAKAKNQHWDEIENQLIPIGMMDMEQLKAVYSAQTPHRFVNQFKGTVYHKIFGSYFGIGGRAKKRSVLTEGLSSHVLKELSDELEFSLYDQLMVDVPTIDRACKDLKDVFTYYIDGMNAIKLQQAKEQEKEFKDLKLFVSGSVNKSTLKHIFPNPNPEHWAVVFPPELHEVLEGNPSAVQMEKRLRKMYFSSIRKIFFKDMVGLGVLAAFMLLRLREFQNVLAVLKAKRMGVSRQMLEEILPV